MQFILEKKKKKLSNSNRVLASKYIIMAIMIIITIVKDAQVFQWIWQTGEAAAAVQCFPISMSSCVCSVLMTAQMQTLSRIIVRYTQDM